MSYSEAIAIGGAFLNSILGLLYRNFVSSKEDALVLAFWNSVFGGVFLAAILSFPGLNSIPLPAVILLLASGAAWTAMVYFDIRAYGAFEITLNALLNSVRLVMMVLIGRVFFAEPLGAQKCIGMVLMIAAFWVTMRGNRILQSTGGRYRIYSIACGTVALAIDKYLTQKVSVELVLLNGYFVPAALYALFGTRIVLSVGSYTSGRLLKILVSSAAYAGVGYGLIIGLGLGELSTTMILNQTTLIFSFLLGILFLRERNNLVGKSVAVALALGGAILTMNSSS